MSTEHPIVVALVTNVFLGVRLKQLATELGYDLHIVPDASAFTVQLTQENAALGIVDINARPDWAVISADLKSAALPPILAIGPHMDADGLREAKAAGVTRVVSNGTFHRDGAALIARYAAHPPDDGLLRDTESNSDH